MDVYDDSEVECVFWDIARFLLFGYLIAMVILFFIFIYGIYLA